MSRSAATLLLALAAVLWSTAGVLIKAIDWNPMAISACRSLLSALTVAVLLGRPRLPRDRRAVWGIVAYAATVHLFVLGNKYTQAANVILLQFTAPIYVALFSRWFLGEAVTWVDWGAIVWVLGGLALILGDGLTTSGLAGNLCGAASGVAFGWTALLLRKQRSERPSDIVFWGNILTFVVGAPFLGGPPTEAGAWLALLALGVLQLGLGYVLFVKAIPHVPAMDAIIVPVLEPLLNPLWVFLVHRESFGILVVVGGALVVSGVVGRALLKNLALRLRRRRLDR